MPYIGIFTKKASIHANHRMLFDQDSDSGFDIRSIIDILRLPR